MKNLFATAAAVVGIWLPQLATAGETVMVRMDNSISATANTLLSSQTLIETPPHPACIQAMHNGQAAAGWQLWKIRPGANAEQVAKEISVQFPGAQAEPNYSRPPLFRPAELSSVNHPLWALENTGQQITPGTDNPSNGSDLNLVAAWDITRGSSEVVVAIIDDGVDINHPDLQSNIWANRGEIPNDGIDNDQNGFVDDVHGWDFVFDSNDPQPTAGDFGHGTLVAGALAADDNGFGVVGSAPDIKIMPLRFGYDVHGALEAMQYAADNGAQIINISFGGVFPSTAEYEMIRKLRDRGILVVAAAGNHHNNNDVSGLFPASYDLANIVSVAASDANNELAKWSQYGHVNVDIAAPGVGILTTFASHRSNSGYEYTDGSSLAAPFVAGIAALLKSDDQSLGYREIKSKLLQASKANTNQLPVVAGGVLDAANALNASAIAVPAILRQQWLTSSGPLGNTEAVITLEQYGGVESQWRASLSCTINGQQSASAERLFLTSNSENDTQSFYLDLPIAASTYKDALCSLSLLADDGRTIVRHIQPALSTLAAGSRATANLQTNNQDDYHEWTFEVPAGAEQFELRLQGDADVDLLIRHNARPDYSSAYGLQSENKSNTLIVDRNTLTSASDSSFERITRSNPAPGTWHVLVLNYSQQANVDYELLVNFKAASSDSDPATTPTPTNNLSDSDNSSGGGGGGSASLLLVALLILLGATRARYQQH